MAKLTIKQEPFDDYPDSEFGESSASYTKSSATVDSRSVDSWSSSIIALENIKIEIDTFKIDLEDASAKHEFDETKEVISKPPVANDAPDLGVDLLDSRFVKLEPLDEDDFDIDIIRDKFKAIEQELGDCGVTIRDKAKKECCCPQCYLRLDTAFELEAHMRLHQGLEPYNCQSCEFTCSTAERLRFHVKTHTGETPFECLVCSCCFNTRSDLRTHVKTHKKGDTFPCQYCQKIFQTKYGLVYHSWKHTGQKPYKCLHCDSAFTRRMTLDVHLAREHNKGDVTRKFCIEKVKCEVCGKFLSNRQNYIIHMRGHTGMRPYQCPDCPRKFRDQSNFNYHRKLHKYQYECRRCEQCYTTKQELDEHDCDKNAPRPYVCRRCAATFAGYRAYDRHCVAHRHNGDRGPIKCDKCGKILETKKGFKQHYRMHTGIYPYKCEICGEKFRCASHRTRHVYKKHSGEKPERVRCPYCSRTFSDRRYLNKHQIVHTGRKAYVCDMCDAQFDRMKELRAHRCK